MTKNRKKLIELFIGNLSNSVVHEILERAANEKGHLKSTTKS
jgi:hypothetical protein